MPSLTPWYVLAGAATLSNAGVLGYISWREDNRALRLWAWAWLAWAAAAFALLRLDGHGGERLAAASCGAAWVTSTLCFLAGSYRFSARSLPPRWYAIAATCAVAALMGGIDPRGGSGMVPLVLFQAGGLSTAGVLILRAGRGRAGAWLAGGALIGLALHLFDAPLLAARPRFMAWGFVMQGHLELVRMAPGEAEQVASSLLVMDRAIGQAGRLTAQLLAFGVFRWSWSGRGRRHPACCCGSPTTAVVWMKEC